MQILDTVYGTTIERGKQEVAELQIQPNEVLFIGILHNPSAGVRDAFKRWGDITRGVPTQVGASRLTLMCFDAHDISDRCRFESAAPERRE